MGYVSLGHRVFYNADLSANFGTNLEPSEFFLPQWTPLRLMPTGNVIEVSIRDVR